MPLKLTKRDGVWYVTGTEAGHRVRKSTHLSAVGRDNKARAEAMLADFRDDIRKKVAQGNDAVVTIGFLIDHYLEGKAHHYAYTTRMIFSFFGDDTPINEAIKKVDDCRFEMIKRKLKPGTINNYLTIIGTVFRYARQRKWTDQELSIEKPRIKLTVKSLREDEVDALIDAAEEWLKPHLIFLRNTGLRTGELLCLKREDVDLENRRAVIRETKTGEDRVIPLNEAAINVVKNLPFDGVLFRDHQGLPFNYVKSRCGHYIDRATIRAAKAAGLRHITPHMLRHTFATRLVEAGANIVVVQALGGWKSVASAARYGKADLRTQDKYANLISKDYSDVGNDED